MNAVHKRRKRGLLEYLRREIARKFLKKKSREYLSIHEQMVVFSFDYISQCIAIFGQYESKELHLIKSKIAPALEGKTILDIGANIGNHAIAFSSMAKNVMSFEPNPLAFELLKINTRNLSNTQVFNFGASDVEQELDAHITTGNCGGGSIVGFSTDSAISSSSVRRAIFQLKRLDDVEQVANSCIGLIKIDVEGH